MKALWRAAYTQAHKCTRQAIVPKMHRAWDNQWSYRTREPSAICSHNVLRSASENQIIVIEVGCRPAYVNRTGSAILRGKIVLIGVKAHIACAAICDIAIIERHVGCPSGRITHDDRALPIDDSPGLGAGHGHGIISRNRQCRRRGRSDEQAQQDEFFHLSNPP